MKITQRPVTIYVIELEDNEMRTMRRACEAQMEVIYGRKWRAAPEAIGSATLKLYESLTVALGG